MRERSLEFKVGLLVAVAAVVLAGFLAVLGNFSLRSGYSFYVDYEFIGNLQAGAPVKVSGYKLGKVTDVAFWGGKVDPRTTKPVQVRVTVWVEDRARSSVREDAEFFINTAGVLGEQYLEIVPGPNANAPQVAAGAVMRGANPPRTDLVVSRLYEVLDSVSQVLRSEKDAIAALLKNGAAAVAEVNALLVANRADITALLHNGSGLAAEATTTLRNVNRGVSAQALATFMQNADGALVAAKGTLTQVTPPAMALLTDARRVTGIITEQRVDKAIAVADRAVDAVGHANQLITNVDGLVTDLRAGKGTAGGLLVRDDIYADLRELIRDLKRNPWKLFWKE